MKKILAILLAVMLLTSMAATASAAETTTTKSTTLTTTVPAATYTLNIPADQEIAFGNTSQNIGAVTITDSAGFAVGKNIKVTVSYTEFTSENVDTTIPFEVRLNNLDSGMNCLVASGESILFKGEASGGVEEYNILKTGTGERVTMNGIGIHMESDNWGKALAGEYTATITFTAEVVVEE